MRQKTTLLFTLLFTLLPSSSLLAQLSDAVVCRPKAELKTLQVGNSHNASYALPVPLRNIATIKKTDNAVCNLLFRHKAINGGAYLLASKEKEVVFKDKSANNPTNWNWTVPGGETPTVQTQNARVKYATEGVFDFPTLEVTTAIGKSSYHPDLKIKAGGTSEITTMDTREWGSTYSLTGLPFTEGADVSGYLGGTNNKNIVGVGNLFMLGSDEAYMDGVNVYLLHKPTKYKANATLVLKVWMVQISEGSGIKFTHLPVEVQTLKMADVKADGEDGAWAPIIGGAVAHFKFSTPLDLFGKGIFFISVEGFSNDPTTEDFCVLLDQIGTNLSQADSNNRLAHNSFIRLQGETDYLRPISMFGAGTGSFAICPLIRIPLASTGLSAVGSNESKDFKASHANGILSLTSGQGGNVGIFDTTGKLVKKFNIPAGTTSVTMSDMARGLYIVRGPNGESIKITH